MIVSNPSTKLKFHLVSETIFTHWPLRKAFICE